MNDRQTNSADCTGKVVTLSSLSVSIIGSAVLDRQRSFPPKQKGKNFGARFGSMVCAIAKTSQT